LEVQLAESYIGLASPAFSQNFDRQDSLVRWGVLMCG